jgi:hypothetical protein
MRNLAAEPTHLARFFQALGRSARIVTPVAETQADLFVNLDTTFSALSDVRTDIQRTIVTTPPALATAIRVFPFQRVFLANNEQLVRELKPGIAALRPTADDLGDAFVVGAQVLPRTVALNARLIPLFKSLQAFAEDPLTTLGVNDLRTTSTLLSPTIADLKPAQTVCNYISLWFRNVSSLLSEGDSNGTWQRFIVVAAPSGANNEGGPASAPANGPGPNFLHANPLPNTPGGGRTDECEAANEPWLKGRTVIGNVPGNQGTKTDRTRRALDK